MEVSGVLFLSTRDMAGGAARATYFLAKGVKGKGVELEMLTRHKTGTESWIKTIDNRPLERYANRFAVSIDRLALRMYRNRLKVPWSNNFVSNRRLARTLQENQRLLNLHWVGDGFLPISSIAKYRRPIVWSLYDMWPFTGGCHYDNGCGRFVFGCGNCPILGSTVPDLSSLLLDYKIRKWSEEEVVVVSPSRWLANEAKKSKVLSHLRIEVIPHGTDLSLFRPTNKLEAKALLGLDTNFRYILFASTSGTKDDRKGFHYLIQALKILQKAQQLEGVKLIVLGGSGDASWQRDLSIAVVHISSIANDTLLSLLYSASDLVATPSKQEAFGMTASEAMCCGTPVVGFRHGGILDVVDHLENGYLASPFNVEDLAFGITWALDNENVEIKSIKARQKAIRSYNLEDVASCYINLYQELGLTMH